MSLTRLKWTALGGLFLFVVLLDVVRSRLLPDQEDTDARLLLNALVVLGAIFLVGILFHFIERLHFRLEARNAELLSLHRAALDIAGELDLETVLQKVVDGARQLLGARFGALAVYDSAGRIESFVTSGISEEQRRRIGAPPEGRGLLGVPLREGETLRLRDLSSHPRSAGFPAHHPAMGSLLAVPILCSAPFRGNLYLAEKEHEPEFSAEDEQTLSRFATQSALAIDGAYLHVSQRSLAVAEERLRIAHEMHDGLAQVLASVNATAQAVREYLRAGRIDEATAQLDRLAAAAREVLTEVREGILALRAAGRTDRGMADILRDFVQQWQDQTGIEARVEVADGFLLPSDAELQVVRIAQESLANVRKHARAKAVAVTLEGGDGELRLEVRDDGRGFDPAAAGSSIPPRFGLATMRERAQAIGGRLAIDSSPGGGTCVTLRVPLRRQEPTN
ncbi:MAG: GAF domain-containing sensor histidine kinase [Thermoanaerobaculia bacterium]|nr:MAG: GAF domain-containing sensor histidine kinase [Thermoanaerobaculia bacterium]